MTSAVVTQIIDGRAVEVVEGLGGDQENDASDLPVALDPADLEPAKRRSAKAASAMVSNLPPVRNQGALGSCVAFSAGYFLGTFTTFRARGADMSLAQNQVSPLFLYRNIGQGKCDGTNFSDYARFMIASGAATEASVPYPTNLNDAAAMCNLVGSTSPSNGLDSTLSIGSFEFMSPPNAETIKDYVIRGTPVAAGFNLTQSFQNYTGGIYTAADKDANLGGHGMVIIGYDDSLAYTAADGTSQKGAFRVQNSWGPNWGEQGLVWVSYEAFGRICTDAIVLNPVTTPAVEATGATLTTTTSGQPTVRITSTQQTYVADSKTVILVFNFSLDQPLYVTSFGFTTPGSSTVTQNFQKPIALRSGYLMARRQDNTQWPTGAYPITMTLSSIQNPQQTFVCTGTVTVNAVADTPGLAAGELSENSNVLGSTGSSTATQWLVPAKQ